MTAIDTPRTLSAARNGGVAAVFGQLLANVIAWNEARQTRNALAKLTDRELEDIGLSRGDIAAVAAQSY